MLLPINLRYSFVVIFGALLSVHSVSALTFSGDEVAEAKARLMRQIQLIESIEPYVERPDLGRLYILKASSKKVLQSIEEKGLGRTQTFQLFQELIISYKYSESFLKEVRTQRTNEAVAEVFRIHAQIVEAHGLDANPYTTVTKAVFLQMHKLILELMELPISPELRKDLEDLKVPLGMLIAKAKEGDRRLVYPDAIVVYRKIEALYPAFMRIGTADSAFEIVLNIQGLNEFYADFAQVEKGEKKDAEKESSEAPVKK